MRYPGGTPLFNRVTGQSIPRLDYILNKHPHLACFIPNNCYPMPSPWMPSPSPMPPGLNFPGAEKVKAMLEQLMKTISGLLGALFPSQPQPRPLPPPILYPTPPVVNLPGMPGNQRRLHRQIRQVSREIRSVKQEIRMYERAGRPVPRQLTQKLKFLEQRLAKLQAQVNLPFDRPGFPEFSIPKPFRPDGESWLLNGDTITTQPPLPAEQAVQPASVNTTPTPSTTSQTVGNS